MRSAAHASELIGLLPVVLWEGAIRFYRTQSNGCIKGTYGLLGCVSKNDFDTVR